MIDTDSNSGGGRGDDPARAPTPQSGPTLPFAAGPDAASPSGAESHASDSARASNANRDGTRPASAAPTHPTSGPTANGDERDRRSADRSSGGSAHARSGAARGSQERDDGTQEAVRCLIRCFEQVVREIPRGTGARFGGVTEGLRAAREALDGRSGASDPRTTHARFDTLEAASTEPQRSDSPSTPAGL